MAHTKLTKGKHIAAFPGFVDTFNWLVSCLENLTGSGGISVTGTASGSPVIALTKDDASEETPADDAEYGEESYQTLSVITDISFNLTDTELKANVTRQDVQIVGTGAINTDSVSIMNIKKVGSKEYTLTPKRVIADLKADNNNLTMKVKTVTLVQEDGESATSDVTKTLKSGGDSNIKFTQTSTTEGADISADVYYK